MRTFVDRLHKSETHDDRTRQMLLPPACTTTHKRSHAAMGATDELLQGIVPASPVLSPKLAQWSDEDPPLITNKYVETDRKVVKPRVVSPTAITVAMNECETEKKADSPSSIMESQTVPFIMETVPMMTLLNQQPTAEERFTEAQADARRHGKDPSLKWVYCGDELQGATCGDVIFSREELLQLSSRWAGR